MRILFLGLNLFIYYGINLLLAYYNFFVGLAIVMKDKAALWTDGRYYTQAEQELDCNWILMKQGE